MRDLAFGALAPSSSLFLAFGFFLEDLFPKSDFSFVSEGYHVSSGVVV